MKPNSYALTISFLTILGTVPTFGAPYYVGKNPTPENTIFLSLKDAPIKAQAGRDAGNVMALELQADKNLGEYANISANLPAYLATANATGADSETNIGNIGVRLTLDQVVTEPSARVRWGYFLGVDGYVPTARNWKASVVSLANPTVDYFRYQPYTTTIEPHLGLYASQTYFSAKTNVGYGYNYVSRGTDKNRNQITWQTGVTWHPLEALNVNLEYNTLYLDTASAGGRGRFRHAIVPSVSGDIGPVVAGIFSSFPLDTPTRDRTTVALGVNAGVNF